MRELDDLLMRRVELNEDEEWEWGLVSWWRLDWRAESDNTEDLGGGPATDSDFDGGNKVEVPLINTPAPPHDDAPSAAAPPSGQHTVNIWHDLI